MSKLLTLTKNTFIETLRQPVYAIIIASALLLFIVSPSIVMYSMSDDNKFLREIALSTLFLATLFISIFSASGAIAEELRSKTVITVLSKPVQRPIFIISKFLGVTAAVFVAHYICTIALLMSIRHGVLEHIDDTHDWTVLGSAGGAILLSLLLSTFFNYAYEWRFSSTAIILLAVFSTIAIAFLTFIDRDWQFNPANNGINQLDIYASVLLLLAAIIIIALAIAISARFNIVATLSVCLGIFLLGLITDYTFGKLAQDHIWAKICYFLVPNLQVFWISDAIYEGSQIPLKYILIVAAYAIAYTLGILSFAIAMFQRKQVG
jgi:hypothetical protein